MAYPILAPSNTWYKSSTLRSTITEINIVDTYTPTGNETETWNADVDNNGAIKCYLNGTALTIAGNGSGKIAMNSNSSSLFGCNNPSLSPRPDYFALVEYINGIELFDSSEVTDLSYAFCTLNKLKALNINHFNTSKVISLRSTFTGLTSLTELILTNWNVENVETMNYTFAGHIDYGGEIKITTYGDLSNWNTSKCTNMRCLFQNNTQLVNLNLTNWDVSKVENISHMFTNCYKLSSVGDLSNWRLSSCTLMYSMFSGCNVLKTIGDTANWDTSKCTDMSRMFNNCTSLTSLNVSNWDVSNVTTFKSMFSGGNYGNPPMKIKNLNVSNWDMSSATDISFMFYGFQGCNLDLSKWNVSKVQNFDHMTAHTYINIGGVSNWYTPAATNMNAMFYSVTNEVLDVSNLVTDNVMCFEQMFENCRNLKKIIGLEKFNTSNAVGFSEMFKDCHQLKELDLSSFDTRKARDGVPISTNGTISNTLKDIFLTMPKLEKITLGPNFSLNGDGTCPTNSIAILSTPNPEYISGATGVWYTEEGIPYSSAEVLTHAPGTYYAINPVGKDYLVKADTLKRLADTVRVKTGVNENLKIDEIIDEVNKLPSAIDDNESRVNFYDYDGTLLYTYTVEEFSSMTELPPLPTQEGLICQGWNWNIEDIKAMNREVNVGATYITDDGNTRLYIHLEEGYTSPMLGMGVKGTVTIDWGDGSEPDTLTGGSINTIIYTSNHEYEAAGDYIITLIVNGRVNFSGDSNSGSYILEHSSSMDTQNMKYRSFLQKVEIGGNNIIINSCAFNKCYNLSSITIPDNVTSISGQAFNYCYNLTFITIPNSIASINAYAFQHCYNLTSISIPNSVTKIYAYAFQHCYNLTSITIPDSVTSIASDVFGQCYNLSSITIPNSVKSIGAWVFERCYNLTSITIPDSVTSIGKYIFYGCYNLSSITIPNSIASIDTTSAFAYCYNLSSITIPNSITSIGSQAFTQCYNLSSITIPNSITSIGSQAFGNCNNLTSITIPNSVTSIEGQAFQYCYNMCFYDFTSHTTVPTLSATNVFNGIPSGCEIRVPAALYDEWIAATNWSTYAKYIVGV